MVDTDWVEVENLDGCWMVVATQKVDNFGWTMVVLGFADGRRVLAEMGFEAAEGGVADCVDVGVDFVVIVGLMGVDVLVSRVVVRKDVVVAAAVTSAVGCLADREVQNFVEPGLDYSASFG